MCCPLLCASRWKLVPIEQLLGLADHDEIAPEEQLCPGRCRERCSTLIQLEFQGDGQCVQQQIVTDQLGGFAHEALWSSSSHSPSQHLQDTPHFLNNPITGNCPELDPENVMVME
ncbi:hypothetical protein TNCV_730211 [Trichonephila clavipes]|nr:hypothetical protein TNCV_730211 [Trichonephila clavipes]